MTIEHLNSGEILSQATIYNSVVNVCGLTADNLSLNAKGQTEQILAKIDDRLASCGTDKSKLISATIWLSDISTFDEMNKVWDAWVSPGETPARACVESKLGAPQFTVEIGVIAALD